MDGLVNTQQITDTDVEDSESRLQQAASIARLGHYVWDAVTDRCLFCSDEHARIHGMSVDEYMDTSSTIDGLSHPDDREAVNAAFRALREGQNFELEYRIIIPSGETRFIREIGRPITNADGVVVQEIGTCQDITETKQIELELRDNERRLINAQRLARLGNWEINSNGDRINWSDETFRILCVPVEDRERPDHDHGVSVHPDDLARVRLETRRALQDGKELDATYRLICPDGVTRTIHEVAEVSGSPEAKLLLATVQDITERTRLEEKLSQAQKIEAVGQLTGGIAHDFNNLLGVIQGNAELLSMQDGVNQTLTKAILAASERGAELTSRLLAFSRRQPLDPKAVDPRELLAELRLMLDRTLGETIRIETRFPTSAGFCLADPGQLENALLNLAINARDAMPGGGAIVISSCIRRIEVIDGLRDIDDEPVLGRFVSLSVADNGKGMAPGVIRRSIEPFFTTKGEGQGSGLGLSMVYGFVKQTRGHLTVESTEGQGTTVTLYLPCADSEPTEPEIDQPDPCSAPDGQTILILEDDPDVLAMVAEMASTIGYKTLQALNANDATEMLSEGVPFDLLLTDVVVGSDASGPEFADKLLLQRPDTPVVFMSGYSQQVAEDRGVLGEDRILLRKPFRMKDLAAALRHSLGER